MALFLKKNRSKAAKLAGAALFVLLMFVNLQITTNPNKNGDIDLFGLKVSLFTPSAYAYDPCPGGPACDIYNMNCHIWGVHECGYILCNPGPGGYHCLRN